jgi:hypothetical protein
MRKFTYGHPVESLSVDGLQQFINDFTNNKLVPFLKSEEVPPETSDPMKIIVGKNF